MTKEELEKEAEEWLDKRYLKDMGVRNPCKQAYLAGAEPREKRIAELKATNKKISDECHKLVDILEKKQNENAELKARVEKQDSDILFLKHLTESQRDQFIKAKKIIKLLLWDLKNRSYEPIKDIEQAEQFLSEVEK